MNFTSFQSLEMAIPLDNVSTCRHFTSSNHFQVGASVTLA